MSRRHGTARMRGLAAELKELRIKAGLNTREAARRAGISPSSLNRTELGNRVIGPEETAGLLVVYEVFGKERERILELSREVSLPGWWETNRNLVIPKQLQALIKFESEATRITEVSMLRIPGLMQSHDYIAALMRAAGVPDETARSRIEVRLDRQKVLTHPQAPRYLMIIDEGVLNRPVGGSKVMAYQLRHILVCARRPNIDVRVVPLDRGAHTGLDGSYITLDFPKARSLVLLESKRASGVLDEPDDVSQFQKATATLLETALDSPESVKFLAKKIVDYEKS